MLLLRGCASSLKASLDFIGPAAAAHTRLQEGLAAAEAASTEVAPTADVCTPTAGSDSTKANAATAGGSRLPPSDAAEAEGAAASAAAADRFKAEDTAEASAAAAALDAAKEAAKASGGNSDHLLFDAETFKRMQVLREKIHELQVAGVQTVREADIADVRHLLTERRLLEDVLRLVRDALVAKLQPPTAVAAAAAMHKQHADASNAATAGLQQLEHLAPQLLRHAAFLRTRVAAQKTERLLGLMLLGKPRQLDELMDRMCTARLRLEAAGKAKYLGILAEVFQEPPRAADMRAVANAALHTTEEIEDFCQWLRSGIAFGEETRRLTEQQLEVMRALLAATESLHPAEGEHLDRWSEATAYRPNSDIKIWDDIPNRPQSPSNEQNSDSQKDISRERSGETSSRLPPNGTDSAMQE
ncbi:uncharacterized abhydrolase domain-containing protein DDB_G0269086 [Cyclospora cayetanensis]|uniref:Uncharacterized abhydrolase domain-containing protein DDB_G0269086 n=1 Tax=Cyclospora cayetanensis TaxID=88456 RepID=A0A6P6S298_9EIME|nr:uncharacterized abhydrolase domain-containing protein DDB_G0269086 [Cyclospora cayetanensis]